MHSIQSYFGGIGNVFIASDNLSATFEVRSQKYLINTIIPHFLKYPLITQKCADFLLFKSVLELISQKNHLTPDGFRKIVAVRATLNRGLTLTLQKAFPNIYPVDRPIIELPENIDPNWIAGFVTGEGCFECVYRESNSYRTGFQVSLRFTITQHYRDLELINKLVNNLGCGQVYKAQEDSVVRLTVVKFYDIIDKIIPFFDEYLILGVKSLDYVDFCRIALLIKEKKHLTAEGLEQIRIIKSGMNTGRNYNNPISGITNSPNILQIQQQKRSFHSKVLRSCDRIGSHNKDVLSIIISRPKSSISSCNNKILNPHFVSGFSDGEAYFSIRFNLEQSMKYFSTNANVLAPISNPKSKSKKRLTNFEKKQISLSKDLQEILIGLLLGGVCAQGSQKGVTKGRTCLFFEQSINNKDYIFHLFELFKHHSRSEPKVSERIADKRSGKIYTRVLFATISLSCFNVLYHTFYPKGKKIVP